MQTFCFVSVKNMANHQVTDNQEKTNHVISRPVFKTEISKQTKILTNWVKWVSTFRYQELEELIWKTELSTLVSFETLAWLASLLEKQTRALTERHWFTFSKTRWGSSIRRTEQWRQFPVSFPTCSRSLEERKSKLKCNQSTPECWTIPKNIWLSEIREKKTNFIYEEFRASYLADTWLISLEVIWDTLFRVSLL